MLDVADHTLIRIPTLRTARLVMRAPKASDMAAYTAFRTSRRAAGVGGPFPASQTHEKLCALAGHWQIEGFGRWIVADDRDTPLGVVGFLNPFGWPEPELGWTVFEHAEGKGVAFEAAQAARSYAYDVLGWSTVISCVLPENLRSVALAKRMGATYEGTLEHSDHGPLPIWRHPAPEALQ